MIILLFIVSDDFLLFLPTRVHTNLYFLFLMLLQNMLVSSGFEIYIFCSLFIIGDCY